MRESAHVPLIEWPCDACGRPVADGTGYLHVNELRATRAQVAVELWEKLEKAAGPEEADPGRLFDARQGNPPVPWQVHHEACDPDITTQDYWFAVDRARTFALVLDWVNHLYHKPWVAKGTDLKAFVERLLDRYGVEA